MIARLTLITCLMLPSQLWALATDADQPIAVEADSLEVREADNISIYQGNVLLIQGSLEIRSDRLVIHFDDNNDLVLMEMTGEPARFRQLDDEQQEMMGVAKKIDYLETESTLVLQENARFTRSGDVIESELIRVNTETNAIQAGSSESDQRVKMLIQPRQDSETGN